MRSELPPPVGVLEVEEVYLEYDEPMLFLGRNERGDRFLVSLVDEDEDGQLWYFAFMSPRRIRELRSGAMDIRDAFVMVEGGVVWALKFDQTESRRMEMSPLLAANLDHELLAMAGQRITVPEAKELEPDLAAVASVLRRVVAEIHLSPAGGNRHEIAVEPLARILSGIQSTLDALGQVVAGRPTERSSIKAIDREQTRMHATRTFDGSFGIELRSSMLEGLLAPLQASRATLALAALTELLEIIDDEVNLVEQLRGYRGSRVVLKLSDFLGGFSEELYSVTIRWASPTQGFGGAMSITRTQARAAVQTIKAFDLSEPDIFEVIGQFSGANLDSHSFTLKPEDDGHAETYSGVIEESLANRLRARGVQLQGLTRYRVQIEETRREDVKGSRPRYKLLAVDEVDKVDVPEPPLDF